MYDDGGGDGRGGGDDDDDDDDNTTPRHKTLHFASNALKFCVKEVEATHYPSTMFRSASTSARLKLQAFTAASARMHSTVTLLGGSRDVSCSCWCRSWELKYRHLLCKRFLITTQKP